MSIATILLLILWVYTVIFLVILVKDIIAHKGEVKSEKGTTVVANSGVSLIANFFDTLGIGSFAIATSAWKFTKSISDDLIPGTLNVVFAVPVVTEATIFIQRIDMDPLTLVLMIVSFGRRVSYASQKCYENNRRTAMFHHASPAHPPVSRHRESATGLNACHSE